MRSLRKAARFAILPALRDLVDEPLAPQRPAAQAGHVGQVSSMKTSRLGSM